MTLTVSDAILLGCFLECTLYGVHTTLFILFLVLQRRKNRRFGGPLTLAQILLFGLCTLSFWLDIPSVYFYVTRQDENTFAKLNLASVVLFGIIDCLAQMILLYRCWIIWDNRWVVVAVPGFLALVALVGEFAFFGLQVTEFSGANTSHIYIPTGIATNSVSLAVNALTTSLIVTKILLISWRARPVLGSKSQRPFRIVVALLIESGLLVFAFQLVYVILYFQIPFDIISNATTQIYGITPTLLNIRVAMGTAYDKTTEKTHTLRFAHSEEAATQATGLSMSATGVQSRGNTEPGDASDDEGAADDAV